MKTLPKLDHDSAYDAVCELERLGQTCKYLNTVCTNHSNYMQDSNGYASSSIIDLTLKIALHTVAKLVEHLRKLNEIVGTDTLVSPSNATYAIKRFNSVFGFNISLKSDCYAMIELQYGLEGMSFAKLLEGLGYDPLTQDFWNALISHINATSVHESLSIPATAFDFN